METSEIEVLDDFLSKYQIKSKLPTNFNFLLKDINNKLSYESYLEVLGEYTDLPKAIHSHNNDNRVYLERNIPEVFELTEKLSEINNVNLVSTGFYWYPPFSYCGWHTNSDNEGRRLYYIYSQEENKSFLRSMKDREMVTKYDNLGWTKNDFRVNSDKENLNWHCVGSYTNRISIGFKVLENTKRTISLL